MESVTRERWNRIWMQRTGMLTAMLGLSLGCSSHVLAGYPPTWVSPSTAETWAANEHLIEEYSETIHPITPDSTNKVPLAPGDTARLMMLQPDPRHGAPDKHFLARTDSTPSAVVAQITLVEGMEYKSNPAFLRGWLPMAILDVSDSADGPGVVYPKLNLRRGTSWLYIRHDSATSSWKGSLVRIQGGTIYQDSMVVTIQTDELPPLPVARFVWKPGDDIIWVKCGQNCCKASAQ